MQFLEELLKNFLENFLSEFQTGAISERNFLENSAGIPEETNQGISEETCGGISAKLKKSMEDFWRKEETQEVLKILKKSLETFLRESLKNYL